jgi:hypothetical protein
MGLDVSIIRQDAIIPKAKLRNFLVDVADSCDRANVRAEDDEGWEPPKRKDRLQAAISRALEEYDFDCDFADGGDLFIAMRDRWADDMMDMLKSVSRHVDGVGYFVIYSDGDIWRYVLVDGQVFEQSVAAFVWSGGKSHIAKEIDMDIDLDSVEDFEKLKKALS